MFAIYLSQQDERDREVTINKKDLKGVKSIGIIATVRDEKTHSIVTLAYEPYIIHRGVDRFGVRL
jgi:hypothetical protein